MTRAEDIRIESDEAGFELHVLVDDWPTMTESGWMIVNIHNVAPELFEQVKRVIGSWLAEGEKVRVEREWQLRAAPEPSEDRTGEITSVGRLGEWRSGYAPGFHCSEEDVDESAGLAYDTSDPKHPDYHSVHADHYDNREKGPKERPPGVFDMRRELGRAPTAQEYRDSRGGRCV